MPYTASAKVTIISYEERQILIIFALEFNYMIQIPFRIGHGYDVHALGEGLELWLGGVRIPHTKGCIAHSLWLGGVRIPHTKGCIAHSDGDVAIHALCDAMLGALALGDIGQHFPDTSEEYCGIDSKILLQKVDTLVRSHGYAVSNADITIAAQRPKLAPYIVRMRQTLSASPAARRASPSGPQSCCRPCSALSRIAVIIQKLSFQRFSFFQLSGNPIARTSIDG